MQKSYFGHIWLRGIGALKADTNNSHLGMLWWILDPILLTILFYLTFSSGLRGPNNSDFIFFLLCGMLPFKWTSSCISASASSLSRNKGIMGQVYLPKWIFPATANLSMAIRYLFVLILLISVMIYGDNIPTAKWITLTYIVLCQLFFNLGISYLIASWVPLIPDLSRIIPLIIMGLMFTSGIFFDIGDRPEDIQAILRLNPFVEILDGYRSVLLRGEAISPFQTIYTWTCSTVFLAIGMITFKVFDRYYPRTLT